MKDVIEGMHEFLVEEPFITSEQEPEDCTKEAIDLGICPNKVNLV